MRVLIFIIWLLLGVFYWFVAKNYCCDSTRKVVTNTANDRNSNQASANDDSRITGSDSNSGTAMGANGIGFGKNSYESKLSEKWNAYRDSLIASLEDNQILQIKGYKFQDEEDGIGLSRAKNARQFFDLADEKIKLVEGTYSSNFDENREKDLVTFRNLRNTLKIKEVDDRTLIYFPYASTEKLNDKEVESYLDEVIERINKSGERVKITGHTDNKGTDITNNNLGRGRASAIANYLTRRGISKSKIIVESKGESMPIADNNTDKGRADNRRAELQIIK